MVLVADTFVRIARRHGLDVSFAAGKSEAVVQLVGVQAKAAQEWLAFGGGPQKVSLQDGVPALPLPVGGQIRLVNAYKHLGGMLSSRQLWAAEYPNRVKASTAATHALAKSVLTRRKFSVAARHHVATACCHSRLLYHAGLWTNFSKQQFARLRAAFDRPLRLIAGVAGPPLETFAHTSSAAVSDFCAALPFEWAVTFARLRLAARMVRVSSPTVAALMRSRGAREWRRVVQVSAAAMWLLLPGKLESLPDPTVDFKPWLELWQQFPGQWLRLLRLGADAVVRSPTAAALVLAGLPLGFHSSVVEAEEASSEEEFLCGVCSRWFKSPAAAAAHRAAAHEAGRYAELKKFVCSGVCPVCGVNYHQRLRCLQHLSKQPSPCRTVIETGGIPELTGEAQAAADAEDLAHRRQARLACRHVLAGPPSVRP